MQSIASYIAINEVMMVEIVSTSKPVKTITVKSIIINYEHTKRHFHFSITSDRITIIIYN